MTWVALAFLIGFISHFVSKIPFRNFFFGKQIDALDHEELSDEEEDFFAALRAMGDQDLAMTEPIRPSVVDEEFLTALRAMDDKPTPSTKEMWNAFSTPISVTASPQGIEDLDEDDLDDEDED